MKGRPTTFAALLVVIELVTARADRIIAFMARELGVFGAVAWTALRIATCAALAAVLLVRVAWVRLAAFVLLGSLFVTSFAVRAANDAGITLTAVRLAVDDIGYAGGAASMFVVPSLVRAAVATALLRLLWVTARRTAPTSGRAALAAGVLAAVSAVVTVVAPWPTWLPELVAPPVVVVDALAHRRAGSTPSAVALPHGAAHATHVAVVIDESIRADAFDRETPWLRAHGAEHGVLTTRASAAANCSAASNAVIRSALRVEDVPSDVDGHARLDDYARMAGFEVVVHDHPSGAVGDRDVADAIVRATEGPRPTFVIANKRGAHYPYLDAVPAAERAALARTARGAYDAAVRASVDGFFADLFPRLRGRDVWLIYVSDHAETLEGEPGPLTHCREAEAPAEQSVVPLLVARFGARDDPWLEAIDRAVRAAPATTAFAVAPTVLTVMGFDHADVVRRAGPTLVDAPPGYGATFSGDFQGKGAWWWSQPR